MTRENQFVVMRQKHGSAPYVYGRETTREDAMALIYAIGGDEDDTAVLPDGSTVYNLSRSRDRICDIAWIET